MREYPAHNSRDTTPLTNLAAERYENVLEAAIDYTRRGVRVTPLNGKKPTLDGWPSRMLNEEDLPYYFNNGQNVGGLLGEPSGGLVDVDLDMVQAVAAADVLLPETLEYGRKGNPRSHRLYACDPIPDPKKFSLTKKIANDLGFESGDSATLVEVRSTAQQSAFPPSNHPQGDKYVWYDGGNLLQVNGQELEERVREVATASLLSMCYQQGTRQDFYLHAAGFLGRHLAHERVEAILEAVAVVTGDEEREKRAQAVRDTLEKLDNGERVTGGPALEDLVPGVVALVKKWWGWKRNGAQEKERGVPTHDELRDRWRERHPNTAFGLGEWRRYEDGVWGPVGDLAVEREICEVLEAAKPEGIRPSAHLLTSVQRLGRAWVAVPDETWDSKADILVCSNGTLEISSGTLREHSPRDYALSSVPYAYSPGAGAPTWERYLGSSVAEAADFLQEFAGYSLTVDTSHEIAVWLHGPPGSGKSTFIEGLKAMLGARAGVLGLADVQRSRFALANLPGKTLVVATEQPSDFIHSAHVINAIISGEEIMVEKKFKDAFSVVPRAKICWAMNDLPRVGDANSGLIRRVKVVTLPRLGTKPDPNVKKQIRAEGAGIMNWALVGLRRLRERGRFEIPSCVREATDEFQRTNDVPGLFVEEACLTGDEAKVQASKLYEAYAHWCRTNGHKAQSATSVSGNWRRLGFEKKTLNGRTFYHGLEVNPRWSGEQPGWLIEGWGQG